jgi:hypothetical protein
MFLGVLYCSCIAFFVPNVQLDLTFAHALRTFPLSRVRMLSTNTLVILSCSEQAMRRTGLLTAVFLQGAAAALAAQRLRQVLRVNRRRHEAALVLQRAARVMLLRHRFHLLRTANHQMVAIGELATEI